MVYILYDHVCIKLIYLLFIIYLFIPNPIYPVKNEASKLGIQVSKPGPTPAIPGTQHTYSHIVTAELGQLQPPRPGINLEQVPKSKPSARVACTMCIKCIMHTTPAVGT